MPTVDRMNDGVSRRLLRVDLGAGTVESEPIPDRWIRQYVGGKGLGARYLYDELSAGVDPLGPENALLFVTGPLSGLLPGDARYAVVTKSPLSGAFLDSYSGGEFARRLVGSLEDHAALLVTGEAPEPTAIVLEDGTARLEDARELWGKGVVETCDEFPDEAVACIGPAGENEVAFATVASDRGDHQAGRGGAGAVLGAKRCKAVVACGEPPAGDRLADLRERYERTYSDSETGRWIAASGTVETVDFADEMGVLSTRGWQDNSFEGTADIGIEAVEEAQIGREREDDPVPGGFRVEAGDTEAVPRGATSMSLGAGLGIDDFDAVTTLGAACDRLGIDVISAGNAVAWAVRASQEGYLDRELAFGDGEVALDLLEEITSRETELGDVLARGVAYAAGRYGGTGLVPTIKGMELPAYDPRGSLATALAYATSDRGACHRRSLPVEREPFHGERWSDEHRVRLVCREQTVSSVLWSLVADDFSGSILAEDLGQEWLAAVGIERSVEELARTGERIWTLTRLFNVREGFDRSDDALPGVLTDPPAGTANAGEDESEPGTSADDGGIDPDRFGKLLDRYYAVRGWSADGIPSRPLLERLDLAAVVDAATPVAPSPLDPEDGSPGLER